MKNSTLLLSAVLILLVSFFATDFGNLSGASGARVVDRNTDFERTARGVGSGDVRYSDPGASGFPRGGLFNNCDGGSEGSDGTPFGNKDGDETSQDARYVKAVATAGDWKEFVSACIGVNPSLDKGIMELVYGPSALCNNLGAEKTESGLDRDAYLRCDVSTESPNIGLWTKVKCPDGTRATVTGHDDVTCTPWTLSGQG